MKAAGLFAIAALLCAVPAAAQAQTLRAGTWTGTVQPPDQQPMPVTYIVAGAQDSLTITIRSEQMGSFAVRELHVMSDRLMFSWSPGDANVSCVLMRKDDGSYDGDCKDADGSIGHLVMIPPK